MSITVGYTRSTDNQEIVVDTFETMTEAEAAIASQSQSDVLQYWLASYVKPETNEPEVLGYREP